MVFRRDDSSRSCGYVLTDYGRFALEVGERCQCNQLFVSDGVYQCPECGTVYSVVFGWSLPPRKLRGTSHR